MLRDRDVRKALHEELSVEFRNAPDTLIMDELGLVHGAVRVDIAVINGALHGYEIKSESDTLSRLPKQVEIYNDVMDTLTLVTSHGHLHKANKIIPNWWGISIVTDVGNNITFETLREKQNNPDNNPLAIAKLLWKDEAKEILLHHGIPEKELRGPRKTLYSQISELLPISDLKRIVRKYLRQRTKWRDPLPLLSHDDCCLPISKSKDFL